MNKKEEIILPKGKELERQGFKSYENDEICVFWNPRMCQHAGECVRGNGKVFEVGRRPWIDLSQAETKEIAAIIDQCPSKALQYELKETIRVVFAESKQQAAAYDGDIMIGECQYSAAGTTQWIIAHTGVRPEYNGHGIAKRLVECVIAEARARGVRITPLCSYARHMMCGQDKYKDVLA